MDKIKIIMGDNITNDYIKQALDLDTIVYDDSYRLDLDTCISYHQKNKKIYIMAMNLQDQKIIGYINFSPISEHMYRKLLSGDVRDTIIRDTDIERYTDCSNYWGYMSSIVVHPKMQHRGISKKMCKALGRLLFDLGYDRNIYFNSIIADVVSDIGRHVLCKMGFEEIKFSKHGTQIMELNLFSNNIRTTTFNKRLINLYSCQKKSI